MEDSKTGEEHDEVTVESKLDGSNYLAFKISVDTDEIVKEHA